MSKQGAADWVGTGEAAADQRLEPVYWRTRVFRNIYVRDGKLHRVRGWSAKIQYQGVRRTISLGAVDQDVAAEKAAGLFAQIQQRGWLALGHGQAPASLAAESAQTGRPPFPPQHPDPPRPAKSSGAPLDTGSWPTNHAPGAVCRRGRRCFEKHAYANKQVPAADQRLPRRFRPSLPPPAWTCLDRTTETPNLWQV